MTTSNEAMRAALAFIEDVHENEWSGLHNRDAIVFDLRAALSAEAPAEDGDARLLDFLADPSQNIANVQLPTECVTRNAHSLRDAIDDAMRMHAEMAKGAGK